MRRPPPVAVLGVLLAASFGWLFRGALFVDETFVARDLATFHRAAKSLLPRLVHESSGLPLWNPYYSSGQPFAANPQHALFHPATALLLVLPFEWAFRLQVMLPPLVAAAAMFFLLRSLGRRPWAAAFGALAWGLGGYSLSVTSLLPTLLATCVLPAVLAFAHRVAGRGRRADAAGLALALGLEILAGDPATLLATPVLLAAAVGHALLRRPTAGGRTGGMAHLALGLGLGLGVGAALWVPGVRLAARTVRAAGLTPEHAGIWSMAPLRLAELLSPYALGHVEHGAGFWGLRLYPGQSTPFLFCLYPGLLATVLALAVALHAAAAPRRPRARSALPWMAAGLAGVFLAAGSHLPLWDLVRRLPLFSGVRYPERFVLVALLPLVVLAAHGFDRVARGSRATLRKVRALLVAVMGVFAAAAAPAAPIPAVSTRDALIALVTAALFLMVMEARARGVSRVAPLLLLLTAVDLTLAGDRLLPTRPAREMASPPLIIRQLLAAGVQGPVFHAAGWVAQREREHGFVRPPMPAFWGIATTFEPDFDLTELRWSTAATRAFLGVLETRPPTALHVLRRRGVPAVVRLRADARVVEGQLIKPEGAESIVELRFVEGPRPFAFVAPAVVSAPGEQGWKDAALGLGAAAADTVIVDATDAGRVPAHPSGGRAGVRERGPGRIVLDVEVVGPGPGLIAVNQTWDELWHARVDGAETAVLRADLSLMAVVVPAGRHTVELRYADPWVARGLAVSACALLGVAALARPWRRRASRISAAPAAGA